MAGFTVELDGSKLTTIKLDGLEVVDVSVHGALDQSPKAILSASGGNYTEGVNEHLIWISDHSVPAGKVLKVRFSASCDVNDQGRTIAEVFPDADLSTPIDFSIDAEMAAELRSRPQLHHDFVVSAEVALGLDASAATAATAATATSDDRNTNFRFGLLWDSTRPTQARLRFTTYSLDDVLARREGTIQLMATLSYGDSASFTLLS